MATVAAEMLLRLTWSPPAALRVFNTAPSWREPEPGAFEPIAGFVGGFQEALPQDAPPSARFEPRVLEIRINSQGFRGPELGEKRPGERRILFGGDSLIFGHALAEEDSVPELAAELLRNAGLDAVACNGGVPGYGFVATCKRLRRLRGPTAADALVAAYFLGNDFTDDIAQRSCIVVGGRMFDGPFGNLLRQSWRGRMCVHSRLALLVEAWLIDTGSSASLLSTFRLTPEQEALQRTLPRGAIVGGLYLDAPREHVFNPGSAPAVGAWLNDLESAMRLLREVAGGLPVVVVVLPSRFHIDAALRGKVLSEVGLDPGLLEAGGAQRRVLALCERLGLTAVDATPALARGGAPASLYNRDHVHPSANGNRIIAGVIAEALEPLLR